MRGIMSGRCGARSRLGLAGAILLAASAMPVLLSSCAAPAVPQPAAQPVVVDTDMASDDIMALCYLLEQPGRSVQAITVAGTGEAHGPAGARNALRLVKALDPQRQIPVAYGPPDPLSGFISFPVSWRATADGMYGLKLPAWAGPQPSESAVRLLTDTISQSPRPVEVVTLGPFTNLALALRADPGLAKKISMIYAMAGAVRVDGNEPIQKRAEWNVYVDAAAADLVLRSGIPMTIVPLDASDNVPARLTIDTTAGPDYGVTRTGPTGMPVQIAVSANASAFDQQYLATLNGGRPVPIPAAPAAQRLTVRFNGGGYAFQGPATAAAGQVQVRLTNTSSVPFDGFQLIIGKLAAGRTLADVRDVISRGTVTSVPPWFSVTAVLPGAPGADTPWSTKLPPGVYALVCQQNRGGALYALAAVTIR